LTNKFQKYFFRQFHLPPLEFLPPGSDESFVRQQLLRSGYDQDLTRVSLDGHVVEGGAHSAERREAVVPSGQVSILSVSISAGKLPGDVLSQI
jgi:hypothetical protein